MIGIVPTLKSGRRLCSSLGKLQPKFLLFHLADGHGRRTATTLHENGVDARTDLEHARSAATDIEAAELWWMQPRLADWSALQ
jgi:hypothetical protein